MLSCNPEQTSADAGECLELIDSSKLVDESAAVCSPHPYQHLGSVNLVVTRCCHQLLLEITVCIYFKYRKPRVYHYFGSKPSGIYIHPHAIQQIVQQTPYLTYRIRDSRGYTALYAQNKTPRLRVAWQSRRQPSKKKKETPHYCMDRLPLSEEKKRNAQNATTPFTQYRCCPPAVQRVSPYRRELPSSPCKVAG